MADQKTEIPDILAPGASSITSLLPNPTLVSFTSATTSATHTTSSSISVSATPTSSPSSTSHPLSTGLKAAAIAIPIIFVALLIPLIWLLIRSHQIRRANEQDTDHSKRSSQQPMMPKPMSETKSLVSANVGPRGAAPPPSRPSRPRSKLGSRKSINSLGLFDFEFNAPSTPFMTTKSPRVSRPFSLVRGMSKRDKEPDEFKEMSSTVPRPDKVKEQSGAGAGPGSPMKPEFAPLNQIGLAHTPDQRKPSRSPHRQSNDGGSPVQVSGPSTTRRGPAEHHQGPYENPTSTWYRPQQVTNVENGQEDRGVDRQLSGISRRETSSPLSMTHRYSDVSALTSDEGDHRRSSNIFPGVGNSGGAQPHRLL